MVERIDFDGENGEVEISYKAGGIRFIAEKEQARENRDAASEGSDDHEIEP